MAMEKYGSVSLINSDCLTALKELPFQSIDLILTDPPYNLGLFMQNRDTNLKKMRDNFFGAADWDNLDYESWKASLEVFFGQASRVIKNGGSMIVFMAIIKVESVIAIAEKYGFYYKTTEILHKLNLMPRKETLSNRRKSPSTS